jgi:hypothetical protein
MRFSVHGSGESGEDPPFYVYDNEAHPIARRYARRGIDPGILLPGYSSREAVEREVDRLNGANA